MLFDIDGRWDSRTPDATAEEFWKEYPTLSWLSRLRDSAIKANEISRQPDGTYTSSKLPDGSYEVAVHSAQFTDCSIFAGSNIRRLDLEGSGIVDLRPLAELPLQALDVRETSVTDLSPLALASIARFAAPTAPVEDQGHRLVSDCRLAPISSCSMRMVCR